MRSFYAINIAGYVCAHCDVNEAAFKWRSAFLWKWEKNKIKLMRSCVSFPQPGNLPVCESNSRGAAHHSWDTAQRRSPRPILVQRARTQTCGNNTCTHRQRLKSQTMQIKQPQTKTLFHMCQAPFVFTSQRCRCFSHGDINTEFAQILLPVVWLERRVLKW